MLRIENMIVNVSSLPCSGPVTSSGIDTEKLNASVPMIAIITSGTNSVRARRGCTAARRGPGPSPGLSAAS